MFLIKLVALAKEYANVVIKNMKNINQKEIVLNTEICKNQDEVKFEEEFGTNEYTCSHIFVIENCRKKGRKILTTALIDIIQDEIASMKNKYSEATVIGFFQKKKNTLKSKETIKNQIACSVFDGSEGACIYETNIQQEPETFDLELHEFIEMTGNLDKYMVFEMESNKIREKLDFALKKGITNFILIAGKYSDKDLWFDLVDKVATVKGKTIIILPARMHVITKKSYMEQAINSGATIVCHGMIYGLPQCVSA